MHVTPVAFMVIIGDRPSYLPHDLGLVNRSRLGLPRRQTRPSPPLLGGSASTSHSHRRRTSQPSLLRLRGRR